MTDTETLVERLRTFSVGHYRQPQILQDRIMSEAANEISRLTAALAEAEGRLSDAVRAQTIEECARICEDGTWTKYAVNKSPTQACATAIRSLSPATGTQP